MNLCLGLLVAVLLGACADESQYKRLTEASLGACNENDVCDEAAGETPITCPSDCRSEATGAFCGNGSCEGLETSFNCPEDCAGADEACGDNTCDPMETADSCPQDCSCGNGTCDDDETEASCPADCMACGNGTCDADEDVDSCPADCDAVCGDGLCTAGDEDRADCPQDCCDALVMDPVASVLSFEAVASNDAAYSPTYYYSGVVGNVGGQDAPEVLSVAFWEGDVVADPLVGFAGGGLWERGQIDLSLGENQTWAECQQCVQLFEDVDAQGNERNRYFQVGGVLEVGGGRPDSGTAKIRFNGVTLRQTVAGTNDAQTDPSAACYYIEGGELSMPTYSCGDGTCSAGEMDCPQDCTCGNGTCDVGESPGSCAVDCGAGATCGNGRCEMPQGESKASCPVDCCEVSATQASFSGLTLVSSDAQIEQGTWVYDQYFPQEDLGGGTRSERISIQFFDGGDVPAMGDAPLMYDLNPSGDPNNPNPNEQYLSCEQCLLLFEDFEPVDMQATYAANYFQRQGTLEVARAPSSEMPEVVLHDTVLLEAEIDWPNEVCDADGNNCQGGGGTYSTQFRSMPRCYYFDDVRFGTP